MKNYEFDNGKIIPKYGIFNSLDPAAIIPANFDNSNLTDFLNGILEAKDTEVEYECQLGEQGYLVTKGNDTTIFASFSNEENHYKTEEIILFIKEWQNALLK